MGYYLDKTVASYLVKAQLCSDAGKGIVHNRRSILATNCEMAGYEKKDFFIKKAIHKILLCRKKGIDPGFHFYVAAGDGSDFADTIVYFNFKDEYGDRCQMSFHTPGDYRKYLGHENDRHRTSWNREIGGSRESADYLFSYLQLEVLKRKGWVSIYNYE